MKLLTFICCNVWSNKSVNGRNIQVMYICISLFVEYDCSILRVSNPLNIIDETNSDGVAMGRSLLPKKKNLSQDLKCVIIAKY